MQQLAGIAVDALSVGGLETCIQVPGWKLAFDIGRCPHSVVNRSHVLFTHAHMDHMGGVAFHAATRSMRGMAPPTYLVPHENAAAFEELFDVWRKLDRSRMPHRMVAIGPGEQFELPNRHLVRPFRSPHRVPCQGYGIWSVRHRLRAEFKGLPGREIARLRTQEGVEVSETFEAPELVFTGDAKIEVLEREPVVGQAKVLIMEVTFVDDRVSVKQCRSKGHIHLDEVVERAELFENQAIMFTHFSARYSRREILMNLDKKLPPDLRERVTPLLTSHR
jgi:ribonuclease Z